MSVRTCLVGKETILLDLDRDVSGDGGERNYELWRADGYATKEIAAQIEAVFERHRFALSNADAVTYEPGTAQNLIFTR